MLSHSSWHYNSQPASFGFFQHTQLPVAVYVRFLRRLKNSPISQILRFGLIVHIHSKIIQSKEPLQFQSNSFIYQKHIYSILQKALLTISIPLSPGAYFYYYSIPFVTQLHLTTGRRLCVVSFVL